MLTDKQTDRHRQTDTTENNTILDVWVVKSDTARKQEYLHDNPIAVIKRQSHSSSQRFILGAFVGSQDNCINLKICRISSSNQGEKLEV